LNLVMTGPDDLAAVVHGCHGFLPTCSTGSHHVSAHLGDLAMVVKSTTGESRVWGLHSHIWLKTAPGTCASHKFRQGNTFSW
jgi:hypothetical protein